MVIYPDGIWMKVTNKKDIDLIIENISKIKRSKKSLIKIKMYDTIFAPISSVGTICYLCS